MLGEKIYKVQAQRVLPPNAEGPCMEVIFGGSLQGSGRLASFKGMATATYVTVTSPDGILYGKGAILESAVDFETDPGNSTRQYYL